MSSIAVLLPLREKFSPQGAGALALCSYEFAAASRFRQDIAVYGRPVDAPFDDVQFIPLPGNRWFFKNVAHLRTFRRALEARPPSLIETWNRPVFLEPLKEWFPDIPVTLHLENDPQGMRAAGTAAERQRLMQLADRVYTCSDWVRARFTEGLADRDRVAHVVTIPNAVDLPDQPASKEKLILFVGRIVPEKGVLLFARAMRMLLAHFPDWRAQIVGIWHGKHGLSEYSRQVAREFTEVGRQAIVTDYLPLREVRTLMRRAAVLCVPSLWNEPFGRVAAEGLAEGALVATTGRGGLGEVIGPAGLVINSDDPQVWSESLVPWLREPERLAEAAERGRQQARNFSLATVTAKLDAHRAQLLGGGKAKAAPT